MTINDPTFATQNAVIAAYTARAAYAAVHTSNTPTSGNELTGAGSSRGLIAWGTIASGSVTGSATVNVPTAGGNIQGVGLWTASTAGTLVDGQFDVNDVTYPGGGTAVITFTVVTAAVAASPSGWDGIAALARTPDSLVVGTITRDSNGAAVSAAVLWPDGNPGTYTTLVASTAFPGAIDSYQITYGSPVIHTYTQPTVTRDSISGATITVPAIVVT